MKPLSVSLPIESIRLDTDAIICCMAFMALYMLVMIKSIRFTVCKAFCAAAIIPLPVLTASCPLLYLDSASDLALKAALAASSSPFFIASSYALEAFLMSAIACCISFIPAIIFDFPASYLLLYRPSIPSFMYVCKSDWLFFIIFSICLSTRSSSFMYSFALIAPDLNALLSISLTLSATVFAASIDIASTAPKKF